jgi:CubicO group peptidase (beta-lactamase class C family)
MKHFVALAMTLLLAVPGFAQDTARTEQVMQSFVANGFAGSVLVARGDEVVFEKSYGAPPARFAVASFTKQFTAAAILLLEERGKLRLDDPVKKHLPNAPTAWDGMTIFHLLTHTAGFAGLQTPLAQRGAGQIQGESTAAGYIARLMERPLVAQPGATFSYTNTGYFILGHLIERLSGQSYERFMTENIFAPLGLKDTGPDPVANKTMASPTTIAVTPNAAAGFSSTPRDLLRWQLGLHGGKVISAASLAKMTTLHKENYGLGVYVQTMDGRRMIRHGGGAPAFAHLTWYPEKRISVVVLGSVPTAPAPEVAALLGTLAHGGQVTLASERKSITVPEPVLARYAGTYELGGPMTITVSGGQLHIGTPPQSTLLLAESETVFYAQGSNMRVEFIRDASGAVTEMVLQSGTRQDRAKRAGRE